MNLFFAQAAPPETLTEIVTNSVATTTDVVISLLVLAFGAFLAYAFYHVGKRLLLEVAALRERWVVLLICALCFALPSCSSVVRPLSTKDTAPSFAAWYFN